MRKLFQRLRSQKGASLVEYALIASLIALPSVAAMEAISDTMNDEFNAIEDNAASAGHGTTTTAAPGATTTTSGATTTTTSGATTTTTAPTTTTSTTTTSTTTTTTTTTTAAPAPTTTTLPPGAPAYQEELVETDAGWFRIVAENGNIYLDGYSLGYRWRGVQYHDSDGNLHIDLDKRRSRAEVSIFAWLDSDGFLHISVS